MANTQGDIRFRVGLETDQQSFNKLKESLQALQKITPSNFQGTFRELVEVKSTAKEIEAALNKAFNPQLGTINISTFNDELDISRVKVDQIYAIFSKAGAQGKVAFNQMATSVLTTNLKLRETHSLLNEMGTTMMNTVKWGIASSVMNTFTGSVRQAFQYVKSLQGSLTDIRIVTGDSTEQMQRFAQSANKAAQELGRSTLDYTKSSLTFYQQGLDDETVQARTEAVLKAQNITGAGSQMADYLTSVWNGYKVANEEAELYVDKLAAVADSSASNMSQLAIAMSKVASTANIMGVDVDQLTAQIATVVATTRQAPESVGTAFKTIYARLNDIKTGADDAQISLGNYSGKMASLGINVLDANGKLRDTGQVMEEIGSKWATMTREQQMYLAATMGGQRQITQVTALFDNWGKYTDLLNISLDSQGTLVEKNSIYMDSLGAKMEQLGAAGERVKASLIETNDIKGLISGLTQVVNLVANFTESFGGGTNALLAFSGIATQLFSGTISSEINNFIINLQNAKFNAEQLAQVMSKAQMFGQSQGYNDGVITNLVDATLKVQQYQDVMTAAQHQEYEGYVRNIAEAEQHLITLEKNREIAQQFLNALSVSKGTKDLDELYGALQAVENKVKNFQKNINNFNFNNFDSSSLAVKNLTEEFNSLEKIAGKKTLSSLEGYDKVKDSFDKATEAVRKLNDAINNGATKSIGGFQRSANQKIESLQRSLIALAKQANLKIQITGNLDQTNSQIKEQKALLESNKTAADQFVASMEQSATVERFVKLTGAIGQAASALRSLSSLPGIWTNENLSGGQKMLQTIMSVSYSIPSLINGYTKLAQVTGTLSEKLFNYTKISEANQVVEEARQAKLTAGFLQEEAAVVKSLAAKKAKLSVDQAATIQQHLNIVYQQRYNALKAQGATQEELDTLAKQKNVLASKIHAGAILNNATATEIDTFAKEGDTVATTRLTAAQELLNKTFLHNPIVLAIAGIAAAVAIGTKVYDALTMSLEQAGEAIDKFNQKKISSNNNINQYNQDRKALEDAAKEWQQLSQKAGTYNSDISKLTDEQKSRYYELSNLIAKYNGSAIAGYDEQGNAILNNNNALKETIDLLKEKNQLEIDSTYGSQEFKDADRGRLTEQKDIRKNLQSQANDLFTSNFSDTQEIPEELKHQWEAIQGQSETIARGEHLETLGQYITNLENFEKQAKALGIKQSETWAETSRLLKQNAQNYLDHNAATEDILNLLSTSDNNELYNKVKQAGGVEAEGILRAYIEGQRAVNQGKTSQEIVDSLNSEEGFLKVLQNLYDNQSFNFENFSRRIAERADNFSSIGKKLQYEKDKANFLMEALSQDEAWQEAFKQAFRNKDFASYLTEVLQQKTGLNNLEVQFDVSGKAKLVGIEVETQGLIEDVQNAMDEAITQRSRGYQRKSSIDAASILPDNLTAEQTSYIVDNYARWLEVTKNEEQALRRVAEQALRVSNVSQDIGGYNSAFKLNAGESLSDEETEAFSSQMEGLKQSYPQLTNAVDILTNKQLEGTEVYGHALDLVRDKLIANTVEMKQLGYSEESLDQQSLSLIHSLNDLKDLQGAMSDKAIAGGLENLAAQYANCSDEVSIFKAALLNGNEAVVEAARNNLELAIRSGQLGQQYGFEADQIEALARIRAEGNKELQNNAQAAAQVAKAELRASRALEDLDKNLDDYADILKKIGKGQQGDVIAEDWETYDGLKDTLADLLDVNKELVGDDWIADNWETIQQAIKGNEDAINELDSSVSNNLFNDLENLLTTDALDYLNGDLDSLAERLNDLPQGELKIDDYQFLNVLANAMAQAGMTAQQIEDAFASKNIYLNVEPATESLDALLQSAGYTGQGLVENLATDIQTTTTTDKAQDRVEAAGVRYERGGTLQTDVSIPTITTENGMPSSFGANRVGHAYWQGVRAIMTPAVDTLNKQTTSTAVQVSNPYKGKKAGGNISNKTKPGTNKKSGGGGKGKGKKGGGGSSKNTNTTSAVKSTFDRYHDVNKAIAKRTRDLTKQQQKQAKLNGKDLIDNLNQQSKILKEQVELYKQKQAIQQDERKELQESIKKDYKELTKTLNNIPEISFLDNGDISDYAAFMNNLTDAMNAKIKWYDTNQEGRKEEYEKYKESYEKILEDFERYEELIDEEMPDLMDQIQQALDAQLQIELTKFKLRVDLQLDLSEAERDFNEFKRNVIDKLDDEDIFGNAKANFIDLTSYYKEGLDVIDSLTDQLNGTLKELAIIDEGGYSPVYGKDRVKALEDLQNYMESLMDNLSDVEQLVGDIKDSIFDMIDAADEAMEKQLDGYDYIADLIDHGMNLINLYYGDDAYKEMQKYYDRQNKNDKERLDFLRQQNNLWYQRMIAEQQAMTAIEDKSSQAYKDAQKRFEAYKEQWEDGIKELNDSLQNTLENIIDKYTNSINIIFQNLDKSISNGRGFETINEEWELIGDYSDKYLDRINSMYEIQKLQNAYQEAINNNATNLNAQASLNEMMREQVKYLQDKQRLSQYDVDRANALLQVETKRLALEQARNSKTKLRLRRDSQGNYTYQYTADENDVTQAEKDLADARNSLYNLTKDAYITNLDNMYNYYTNWQGRVKEIFEDTTLTVEERQEQLRTVTEGYSKLIDRLIKDNGELKTFLGEDAFSELTYYGNNPFQEITDFIPELNDYVNEFGSGVQGMIDTIVDSGNFSAIAESLYAALEKEAAGFKEDIDELQVNFNNLALGNDEIIDAEEGFLKNKEDLINLYGDELDAIEEVISAVEELMKTYNAAEKAAIDATTAAYNYQKTDMSNAAAASPNPVSRRVDATEAEQSVVQATAAQQFKTVMDEYSKTTSSFDQISNKIKEDIADVAADAYVPAAAASPILSAQVSGADGQTPYVAVPATALPQTPAAAYPDSSALVNQVVEALQSVKADVDLSNVLSTLGLNGVMIGGTIDQDVHVEVNFPNVTNHFEIEKAFENIVNMAAQYAYRN